ncbi:hypothetical protein FRC11_000924, partial [Ceratobasidium sp. 423]
PEPSGSQPNLPPNPSLPLIPIPPTQRVIPNCRKIDPQHGLAPTALQQSPKPKPPILSMRK